jgi:hypothetical protein
MNKRGEGGISFIGALVLILIFLKLVGVIHCSWWLVFAPVLVEIFLLLVVLVNWDFWSR